MGVLAVPVQSGLETGCVWSRPSQTRRWLVSPAPALETSDPRIEGERSGSYSMVGKGYRKRCDCAETENESIKVFGSGLRASADLHVDELETLRFVDSQMSVGPAKQLGPFHAC